MPPATPVEPAASAPDFVVTVAGAALDVAVVTVGEAPETAAPLGGVPRDVAVFEMLPRSTSTWVTVYVAVAVTACPGESVPVVPEGQVP